jgi:hypothetical protein
MSDQSEDPSPLHPPNTSNVLNFEYQVNFNEADGQITWTLPSGTPGLGAALAVKYPQIGTHRERMSVALAQYFTNNAKQSSPILHSESPTASQPLYTSQQRWVTDNDLVTAACAASKPPPISIQTLPTAALIQGYVDHSDASSRLSVVSTSKLKRKSNVRTRKLTEAGKEEARLNRVHHATCQHHSAAKTKVRFLETSSNPELPTNCVLTM